MPWKEFSAMSSRLEFVRLASAPGANILVLSERFGISRKTAYKWLARYERNGESGLQEVSRRPHSSPSRCMPSLEDRILRLHEANPYWGSRKLKALMLKEQSTSPHHSTIDEVLRRHGRRIEGSQRDRSLALTRFEHAAPNLLWQMDFKGHFGLTDKLAGRCHPLTILDDHSRFNISLVACPNEQRLTVQAGMKNAFERYGMPERITADNGPPWGTHGLKSLTALEVWLIRLGIRITHSRPYHPQTQGKDERFHRTLKLELLSRRGFNSLQSCQRAFDDWREQYNQIRPHEALEQHVPASRYRVSGRPFPAVLPTVEYRPGDTTSKVRANGQFCFKKQDFYVGEGLKGEHVAIRPTPTDGLFTVYFCDVQVQEIDLRISVR